MPEGSPMPRGAPCWVELSSGDSVRAIDFYAGLFGWEVEPLSRRYPGYLIFLCGGVPVAGCSQGDSVSSDAWSVYLAIDDAGRALETAQSAGARLIAPAFAVGEFGTMALMEDPAGASVGVWQAGSFAGFPEGGAHGTATWCELETSETSDEAGFYGEVFGLESRALGRGKHHRQLLAGERRVAGIRGLPRSGGRQPAARWSVYFAVDDVGGTLRTLTSLGGAALGPVVETELGERVEVADAGGGRFQLLSPLHSFSHA